jgi:hypothetical protein
MVIGAKGKQRARQSERKEVPRELVDDFFPSRTIGAGIALVDSHYHTLYPCVHGHFELLGCLSGPTNPRLSHVEV